MQCVYCTTRPHTYTLTIMITIIIISACYYVLYVLLCSYLSQPNRRCQLAVYHSIFCNNNNNNDNNKCNVNYGDQQFARTHRHRRIVPFHLSQFSLITTISLFLSFEFQNCYQQLLVHILRTYFCRTRKIQCNEWKGDGCNHTWNHMCVVVCLQSKIWVQMANSNAHYFYGIYLTKT